MGLPGRHDRLVVTDMADIEKLLCLIHDEFFDIDDVSLDATQSTLDVPFKRCWHGEHGRVVKKNWWRTVVEVPVLHCVFRIGNVSEYELVDTHRMGNNSFNTIDYDDQLKQVTVNTNIPAKFNAKVSQLHLEYFELDFKGLAHISHGWFWEGGPRFVE